MGSTSNELKVRFRNHKSAMLTNKTMCELAVHSIGLNTRCLTLNSLCSKKLLMKVKITLIDVYSQGKLSGAPSCVLSIPTALISGQSLTHKIELGSANEFYVFLIHCLAIFRYYLFYSIFFP